MVRRFWYDWEMKTVTSDCLHELARAATSSQRGRLNHNLHPTLDDPIQRFFNSMDPGSYVQPHRHTDPPRWEVFVALRGRAVVLEFDDGGTVTERAEISPDGPAIAVEIPGGHWHTVAAVEPQTLLFELKPGPYSPVVDKDFVRWAPAEGSTDQTRLVNWFQTARPGDRPSESSP